MAMGRISNQQRNRAFNSGKARDARINTITNEKIAAKQRDQLLAQKTQRDQVRDQAMNRQHEMARTQLLESGQDRRLGTELGFKGAESSKARTHDTSLQDSRIGAERERLLMSNEHAMTMDDRGQQAARLKDNRNLATTLMEKGADAGAAQRIYNTTYADQPTDLTGAQVPVAKTTPYQAIKTTDESGKEVWMGYNKEDNTTTPISAGSQAASQEQGAYSPNLQAIEADRLMIATANTPEEGKAYLAKIRATDPQRYNYLIQQEKIRQAQLNQ